MWSPGERLWTDADYAAAIAWQEESNDRCPGCGQPRSESMSPENEDRYTASRYECFACRAQHERSKAATARDPGVAGYSYYVTTLNGEPDA